MTPERTSKIFPDPTEDYIIAEWEEHPIIKIRIHTLLGQQALEEAIDASEVSKVQIYIRDLAPGVYVLTGFEEGNKNLLSREFIKYRSDRLCLNKSLDSAPC
ncbi:MAG: T9SS type A sorting domain-containing protein [Saprospiraceae bacterium]|nr:T9SS type A sorting domain-containing protein [Saprospiraceae bacterium]